MYDDPNTSTATHIPRLLKAEEVADATGLSKARVYELVRLDMLPAVRLGRSVRFRADQLDQWMQAGGTREAA